jgi:hypothetical protein
MGSERRPYQGFWEASDGLSEAYVHVLRPDGPWPALVSVEATFGGSFTAEDAKDLAAHIGAAADDAGHLSREHFRALPVAEEDTPA